MVKKTLEEKDDEKYVLAKKLKEEKMVRHKGVSHGMSAPLSVVLA